MYKIIIDSCGELTDSLKKDEHFCNVALELDVDGYRIRDDESFDQHDFLRRVKESVKGPKSSCPSPEDTVRNRRFAARRYPCRKRHRKFTVQTRTPPFFLCSLFRKAEKTQTIPYIPTGSDS